MSLKVIDVNVGVFDQNDRIAEEVRLRNRERGICLFNIMASPGAGKTTILLRTIEALKKEHRVGVMEADIAASVDAEKMLAPYQPRIAAFIKSLPSWISVKTDVNKTELKKADEMPEGASIVSNKSLRIR